MHLLSKDMICLRPLNPECSHYTFLEQCLVLFGPLCRSSLARFTQRPHISHLTLYSNSRLDAATLLRIHPHFLPTQSRLRETMAAKPRGKHKHASSSSSRRHQTHTASLSHIKTRRFGQKSIKMQAQHLFELRKEL